MGEFDREYYRIRADQEEAAADRAANPAVAEIHLTLAKVYRSICDDRSDGHMVKWSNPQPAYRGGGEDNSRQTPQSGQAAPDRE